MSKLERIEDPWGDVWCTDKDVQELETYTERLRSMLQRILDEATKKRVEWTPTCGWLATSHYSDMYAIHYEINAELMNDIKAVLNNEGEDDND